MKKNTFVFLFASMMGVLWTSVASASTETRWPSPQGKLDVIFQPIDTEHARTAGARKNFHGEVFSQYRIEFWLKGSSEPVNLFDYMDASPLKSAADIFASMLWSPDEKYVALPVMSHARVGNHVFMDLVTLNGTDRILEFDADHVRWISSSRLLGDVNTSEIPGGIILIDAVHRDAQLILAPLPGIGYQIAKTSGDTVTLKEFLNTLPPSDKTSWEAFTPACLTLTLDSLKKRSVPCP